MKTVSLTEINTHFTDYLKAGNGELILITENEQPIAAITLIVDPEELERLMLANNPKFNQLMEDSDQRIKKTGGIKHEDFWKLVEETYSTAEENQVSE